tara:strand:+ start:347 stop:481 length:135 start_codon:yes stop_codon:yes gene_type:complete
MTLHPDLVGVFSLKMSACILFSFADLPDGFISEMFVVMLVFVER